MRKIIEYTLLSLDGVFENPMSWGAMSFRDDVYLRDGLGLMLRCDALLMGRHTYELSAKIWPSRSDAWAQRLNAMQKYVFSSTLHQADWTNSTLVRGDAAVEVAKLKQRVGGDLLMWGHVKLFFRAGQLAKLELASAKSFSKIVKLSYETST